MLSYFNPLIWEQNKISKFWRCLWWPFVLKWNQVLENIGVVLQRRKEPSINGKEVFKNSQIVSLNKKDKRNSRDFLENNSTLI